MNKPLATPMIIDYLKKELQAEVEVQSSYHQKILGDQPSFLYRSGRISGLKTALSMLGEGDFVKKMTDFEERAKVINQSLR